MIFAAPWVLLALPALPLLWWLLRVTPPAPRSESFPAIRLLMGLHAPRGDAGAHTLVAAVAAHGRGDLGDPGTGAAGAGCRLDPGRLRPGAVGGGQRLGLGRRLAASHAGGQYRVGSRRTRRAAGGAARHRAGWLCRSPAGHPAAAGRRSARPGGGAASRALATGSRGRSERCWPGISPTRRWSIWATG